MEKITYKKFKTEVDALELIDLLESNSIDYLIEDLTPSVDASFSGGSVFDDCIAIKLKPTDFEMVDSILNEIASQYVESIDKDYYLFEFSDDELIEVVENFDEWSNQDFLLAQEILKQRGVSFSKTQVEELKNQRISELKRPEKAQKGWLVFGFVSAVLGGILGCVIGFHYLTFKKSLPTGERVFAYDATTRKTGLHIFYLGLAGLFFWGMIYLLDKL